MKWIKTVMFYEITLMKNKKAVTKNFKKNSFNLLHYFFTRKVQCNKLKHYLKSLKKNIFKLFIIEKSNFIIVLE